MRTMWRHRAGLVAEAASCIQRIQKSMAERQAWLSFTPFSMANATRRNWPLWRNPVSKLRKFAYHGQYFDKGAEFYEERHRERQVRAVQKRARQLGLQVINPTPTPLNPAPPGLPT